MNKQELIDDLIDLLDGKLRNHTQVYISGEQIYKYHSETSAQAGFVCTKDEFNQRARELGYCNGYKYGVEYETNGKKPDLPDDVLVEVKICTGEWGCAIPARLIVIDSSPYTEVAFRIVDERYKPVDVEQEKSWHEKGELPPVGEKVEYTAKEIAHGSSIKPGQWYEGIIVAYYDGYVWTSDNGIRHLSNTEFRPLKTERERFVDSACATVKDDNKHMSAVFEQLYDAGFKAPEK